MEGLRETDDGSDDYAGIFGINCTYLGVNGVGKYRVYSKKNGWLPYVEKFDYSDEEYGMAGDGSPIQAVEIPNSEIKYQVHTRQSSWLPEMKGKVSSDGSGEEYAGEMGENIDAIRV